MKSANSVQKPHRRYGWILAIQGLWSLTLLALVVWWGSLLFNQARRISELEKLGGVSIEISDAQWLKTERMLLAESSFFFFALFATSLLLFWLNWREIRRSRSLHVFFASLTHELKTPIASVRLQSESLGEMLEAARLKPMSVEQNAQAETLLNRLLSDTDRLENHVERALELARVEGGGKLLRQEFDPLPLIREQLRRWKSTYPDQLETEEHLESVMILGDPVAFQMIFRNLLENSLKHSQMDKVKIRITAEPSGEQAIIRFLDNGKGFAGPARALGKLFSRGANSQGTGVGLYLVQELVERMGGKAHFTGQPHFSAEIILRRGSETQGPRHV